MRYSYEHELVTPITGLAIKYYLCRVQYNPLHWHRELELLCCVDGELDVMTPNSRKSLRAGDILLINRNDVHRVLGEETDNKAVIIQFDIRAFKPLFAEIDGYAFECDSTKEDGKEYKILWRLVREFVETMKKKEEGYYLELGALRNRMLVMFMRYYGYKKRENAEMEIHDGELSRLISILKYIEENFSRKITLEEVAKSCYLNPYYFSHYFHDKMGMTFRQFLTYTRVDHARKRLIETKDKVMDIAVASGFSGAQSFSRAFKEEFGKSPGQYRQAMGDRDDRMKGFPGHSLVMLEPETILEKIDAHRLCE